MKIIKSIVAIAVLASSVGLPAATGSFLDDAHVEGSDSIFDARADIHGKSTEVDRDEVRKLTGKLVRVRRRETVNVELNVTNLSFQQPFGRFFVMVHNRRVDPIFTLGRPSSGALRELAENGSPDALIAAYQNNRNVLYVGSAGTVPVIGENKLRITVPVRRGRLYVTIASMCLNTNDW